MYYVAQIYAFVSSFCFRLYHFFLLPLRYKISVKGVKDLEAQKTSPGAGILFLSNHPSHLDPSLIGTMLIKEGYLINIWTMDFVFRNPYTKLVARNFETTKLLKVPNVHEERSPKNHIKVRRLIRRTVEGLQEGENILFFPAGYQKFTAREEVSGKSAVQHILRQYPNVNIVMVRITGMWGSRFSKAVRRSERSDIRSGWHRFLWKIVKIFFLNFIFFIPKRKVTIEFCPVGADFPRQGSRKEINQYLENYFNKGFGVAGEPLQRVPDYFWKAQYPTNEYHVKCYHYDIAQAPQEIVQDVIHRVAKKAGVNSEDIGYKMTLDRDLSLDSLEITELLIELESKYSMQKSMPKNITDIGHLIALAAHLPIEYVPIRGEFPVVHEEPAVFVHAWHIVAAFVTSFFGFLFPEK